MIVCLDRLRHGARVTCLVYINNASITQKMRILYINGFILETCHICMESLIISLHGKVKTSKFLKKSPFPNSTSYPPYIHLYINSQKRHFVTPTMNRDQGYQLPPPPIYTQILPPVYGSSHRHA